MCQYRGTRRWTEAVHSFLRGDRGVLEAEHWTLVVDLPDVVGYFSSSSPRLPALESLRGGPSALLESCVTSRAERTSTGAVCILPRTRPLLHRATKRKRECRSREWGGFTLQLGSNPPGQITRDLAMGKAYGHSQKSSRRGDNVNGDCCSEFTAGSKPAYTFRTLCM